MKTRDDEFIVYLCAIYLSTAMSVGDLTSSTVFVYWIDEILIDVRLGKTKHGKLLNDLFRRRVALSLSTIGGLFYNLFSSSLERESS